LDGHFATSCGFIRDSGEYAIEWAKQLLEDRPIELWSDARLVKRLSAPVVSAEARPHEIHEGRMVSR
jgi:hypothetical protein